MLGVEWQEENTIYGKLGELTDFFTVGRAEKKGGEVEK